MLEVSKCLYQFEKPIVKIISYDLGWIYNKS